MKLAKLSACILAASALVGAALGQSAYASRYHTVNAGIVVVTSTGFVNDVPHVWNNLDQNVLVKPASWNFENPGAPTTVTGAINARWGATIGTQIRMDNAAYWEVNLATISDDDLADYDVLLLPAYGNLNLTGYETARLRRFMDNGGTLWVDVQSTTTADLFNGLPLPIQISTSTGSRAADFLNPLLNQPYSLSMGDIRSAEYPGDTGAFGNPSGLTGAMGAANHFSPVVLDGSLATIGVSSVGNGFIVVTTRGVARVLNQGLNDAVNNGYQAKDAVFNRAAIAAGKLVINAVSLNSSHRQAAQGTRATNSIRSDLGAPLLPSFQLHGATLGATGATRPPVFYKGIMAITSDDTIYVYNAKPGNSLSGSPTNDDGVQDYSLGSSYDLIWKTSLTGPISTPTCAEVPLSVVKDQLMVVDGNGALQVFNAYTGAVAYSVSPVSGAVARTQASVPNAPTFHENVVYVADAQSSGSTAGRVWMANPITGAAFTSGKGSEFAIGGTLAPVFGEFSAAPTVGYVPVQDNSGALDKVVYVPAFQIPGGSGPTATAAIYSMWVGVKGETYKLGTADTDAKFDGAYIEVPVRAYSQSCDVYETSDPNDPLGVHFSLTWPDGHPWSQAEIDDLFDVSTPYTAPAGGYNGSHIGLKAKRNFTAAEEGSSLRIDYTIDWGLGSSASSNILRGVLYLPDDTNHARNILGNLTLTPAGNLIAVLSQGTPPLADPASSTAMNQKGGSIYNFTEKGRGIFRLNYRFEAYDSHTIQTNQGTSIHYPEAFTDNDVQLSSFLDNGSADSNGQFPNAIKNLTFTSGATVRDGVVYVTAAGWKNTSASNLANWIPVSVVIALKENPDPVVIFTGDLSQNFQIVQPDICASDDKSNPTHFSVLQPNQYSYVKDAGSAVGTLSITNLMDRDNGSIGNALSTNQPIILRQSGSVDQVIEPNQTAGSIWNPMLWYAIFPGYHLDGATMVTGDTLFGTGWSVLPGLLNGVSDYYASRVSSVVAFNAAINSNDSASFVNDARRPWMAQAHVFGGGGSSVASSNLLWPTGITDAASVGTRVAQEALAGSATGVHITAGEGVLAVTGDNGLYAFDSSSLLVADASRVARFSPAGDALWSSESTFASATLRDAGSTASVRDLVTPVRAYPFKSDTLIVDAGANRVIRMSDTGRESRSIRSIQLDPNGFRPDGFAANESLSLSRPSDVAAYTEYVASGDSRLARLSNPQPLEYWVHYMIADTGNKRLIDLIDRYYADPATQEIGDPVSVANVPQLGVLLWHSPSAYSGKNWAYNSVSRTRIVSGATSHDVIAAGIGNAATTLGDLGLSGGSGAAEATGNGSIVLFDNTGTIVINKVKVLASSGNVFWNGSAFGPDTLPDRYRKLGSLSSVTLSRVSTNNLPLVMYTDSSGVYEVAFDGTDWTVRWMLPANVYTSMRGVNAPYGGTGQPAGPGTPSGNPVALHATYARRLDEDHVLLVNGLVSGDFKGEVLVVSGAIDSTNSNSVPGFGFNKTNLGFGTNSIRYQLQDVRGARAIQGPVFADRR